MKFKIEMRYIGIKSKENYTYQLNDYGKHNNILLVDGLSGAGKTTYAKKLANEYGAQVISTDWLYWESDSDNKKFANALLCDFYKEYPEVEKLMLEKKRGTRLSKKQIDIIGNSYNTYLISYCANHKDKLFVLEGISIHRRIPMTKIRNCSLIVIGTGIIKSFFRRAYRELKNGNWSKKNGISRVGVLYKLYNLDCKNINKMIRNIEMQ